jgi:hypothetical protein
MTVSKQRKYEEKNPWIKHFVSIRQRCNNPKATAYKYYGAKGIRCNLTLSEVKTLWFRDKAYTLVRPSIDRFKHWEHYTFKNCQFIELAENSGKDKRIRVLQFDSSGYPIKIWPSISDIERELGFRNQNISFAIKNRTKSHGYYWRKYDEYI